VPIVRCQFKRQKIMGEIPFTLETMPQALKYIIEKLIELEKKVDSLQGEKKEVENEWMNIKDLCSYLPSHPAEQTVYGWTSNHQIPFYKKGKGIMFRKSEIEEWLNDGEKRKTEQELEDEAEDYINSRRRRMF
jgi:excisionase family DNA binding protein